MNINSIIRSMSTAGTPASGRHLRLLLVTALLLPLAPLASAEEPVVTYAKDIKPLLQGRCTSCHSGWFPSAGLDLDELESILEGSRSGPLVVAGRPDKGWLMHVVNQTSGRLRMPPKGPQLSAAQKQLLQRWIEQGLRP
jgi:mono/diheme cytochrome c family protein